MDIKTRPNTNSFATGSPSTSSPAGPPNCTVTRCELILLFLCLDIVSAVSKSNSFIWVKPNFETVWSIQDFLLAF